MKPSKIIYGLSALVLVASLTLAGCKKNTTNQEPTPDTDQSAASDNTTAENMMNDVVSIGSQGSENGSLSTYKNTNPIVDAYFMSACATINVNTTAKTFTVDFGSTPCLCLDNRMRSGQLYFDYSASANFPTSYRMPGFKMTVTSNNYVVDGYTVNITNKTVTNTTPLSIPTGTNPGTNLTWSISANVTINKPSNGGTITWNCNRTKELLNTNDPLCYQGQLAPIIWSKAKIRLNGVANGVTAGGDNYTAQIKNLVRDFGGCKINGRYPFISGQLEFTPGTKATRYIDFGAGTCDNSGTITINGITYTFNF